MPINYRKALLLLLPLLLLFANTAATAQRPAPIPADSDSVETAYVQGKIYVIATGGSNIGVMLGEQGLVIVDGGNAEAAENVATAITELSDMPARYIINTTPLPGHLEGNSAISQLGSLKALIGVGEDVGIPIIAHGDSLTLLLTHFNDEVPYDLWPNNTFFRDLRTIYLNDEAIEIIHQPAAITMADVFVHFRNSDVLFTGDIFDITAYPHFYPEYGGSVEGLIDALNNIIDIAVPEFNQQGGTLIIPGHGRIASESDVVEYRDMLTIISERMQRRIDEGLSFEAILADEISLEYDGIYGSDTGDWTTRMFLEAVYEDLR